MFSADIPSESLLAGFSDSLSFGGLLVGGGGIDIFVVGDISIVSGSDMAGGPVLLLVGEDTEDRIGIDFACAGRWPGEKAGRGIDSVVAMLAIVSVVDLKIKKSAKCCEETLWERSDPRSHGRATGLGRNKAVKIKLPKKRLYTERGCFRL